MAKTKKRKNYFAVELEIQKLLNVPYVRLKFSIELSFVREKIRGHGFLSRPRAPR